jgi:hypothetical protein
MTATRFIAAAALSIAAAAPAFAQEATADTWTTIAQPQSRATVMAELADARAHGGLQALRLGHIESVDHGVSRQAVRTATLAALANGEVAAIDAEAPGLGQPAHTGHSVMAALR